jgi:cytochrome c biogenesis protein CcdA
VFALGTTVPLLALAGALRAGTGGLKGVLRGARRAGAWTRPAAGMVLLLAGLNDTMTYWLLS